MAAEEDTKPFLGDERERDTVRPTGPASCKFYAIVTLVVLLSPVLFALIVGWALLGMLFTIHPYMLTVAGIMGVWIIFILTGYTAEGVEPQAFFDRDFGFPYDSSLSDAAIMTTLAMAIMVWSTVLTRNTRGWCAVPAYFFGLAYNISKMASRASWQYAATGTLVFYVFTLTMLTALFASVLTLWLPVSHEELVEAEDALLCMDHEDGGRGRERYRRFKCAGLGTLEFPPLGESVDRHPRPVMLMVHGYGSGNGMWAMNVDVFAKYFRVYCVDWLGCGTSDRPPFEATTGEEAEAYFVDAMERWRVEMKVEKMVLVGHSVGGVLCTSYTQRFPHRVSHLVLVSPAGVVGPPKKPEKLHPLVRMLRSLWPFLTPQAMMRFSGPLAPLVSRYGNSTRATFAPASSRIRNHPHGPRLIGEYTFQNWCMEPCGEKALNLILTPGVYGRNPLNKRITREMHTPVTFLYGGSGDWMDYRHAMALIVRLRTEGKDNVNLYTVAHSGHQLFMDNPGEFNALLLYSVAQTLQDEYPHLRGLAEGHGLVLNDEGRPMDIRV